MKPPGWIWVVMGAALVAVLLLAFLLRGMRSPERNQSAARPGDFQDRAQEAGLDFRMHFLPGEQGEMFKVNLYDHGCGILLADFNGDGHDDVYFLNQLGSNALYWNKGDATFAAAGDEADVLGMDDRVCVGGACGDYDNDGDQDLYVTSTRGGNVLFENQGQGRFQDVTAKAHVECVAHSHGAAFFDCDGDGDLDLFLTNSGKWTTDQFDEDARYFTGPVGLFDQISGAEQHESNILYRNRGDGTFADVTTKAGLAGRGWNVDCAAFDSDDDGDLDLVVTGMFGATGFYRNDGRGRFSAATRAVLGRTSFGAMGARSFDFNNDGRLDLFVTDMHSDMWMGPTRRMRDFDPSKKYDRLMGPHADGSINDALFEQDFLERVNVRYEQVLFGNTLYQNRGNGRFREVSDKAGMETFWPWGAVTGDFDNDGNEDVFIPSGMGYPFIYWPNSLMVNNGDGTFTDRAADAGIEPPRHGTDLEAEIAGQPAARSSRAAAAADFDGDGRLDIVVNNFNDRPYFFRNGFPRRNYIAFRLRGTKSNRDAIGAVVRLHFGREIMTRQVQAAGGYLSQSSKTLHFGLGNRTRIDRIEVRWPSGRRQELSDVEINNLHEIVEPQALEPSDDHRATDTL